MHVVRTVLALAFSSASLLAAPQGGATLLVPAQYATIQAAISAAPSLATILVDPGTYNEVLDLLGKDVEVIGVAGPEFTVIDGTGANNSCVTANSGETLVAVVRGFTLTHGTGKPFPSSYGFDYYGGGVYIGGASSLRVENCWILDNALSTGTFAGGIYAGGTGSHAEVRGCLIVGNHGWASGGATLVDGDATMHLERCTVYGNTANSWAFGHQGGVSMANGGDVTVKDCIVWGNAGYQIHPFGGIYGNGTSAVVSYSCVEGGYTGVGNISTNPLFVAASSRDYHLQSNSLCIDAGDPASPLDPDGTRADMGCFYHAQVAPVTATATTYGAGCGTPALDFSPTSNPIIGTAGSALISNAPTSFAGVTMGWSNSHLAGVPLLPLDLAFIGMPGCSMLVSNDVIGLPVTPLTATTLQFDYAIPFAPHLLGAHVYVQAYCVAPSGNPLQIIASNGIDWLIGNQ
jgi:hypothetical protein